MGGVGRTGDGVVVEGTLVRTEVGMAGQSGEARWGWGVGVV